MRRRTNTTMAAAATRNERMLVLMCALLLAIACCAPPMTQWSGYHEFADRRTLWGVMYAGDVFSNAAFALASLAGAVVLLRLPRRFLSNMQRAMAWLFVGGLGVVAIGSSAYHLDPNNATLIADRSAMALAFSGLLGLAAADTLGDRAAAVLGMGGVIAGEIAVWVWAAHGNVVPWAVYQGGGIALIGWMAMLPCQDGALKVQWLLVLIAYGVAKLFEISDHAVFEATGSMVSGHTLKHVAAALAAAPVLSAIRQCRHSRQNAPGFAFTPDLGVPRGTRA